MISYKIIKKQIKEVNEFFRNNPRCMTLEKGFSVYLTKSDEYLICILLKERYKDDIYK